MNFMRLHAAWQMPLNNNQRHDTYVRGIKFRFHLTCLNLCDAFEAFIKWLSICIKRSGICCQGYAISHTSPIATLLCYHPLGIHSSVEMLNPHTHAIIKWALWLAGIELYLHNAKFTFEAHGNYSVTAPYPGENGNQYKLGHKTDFMNVFRV